MGWTGRNILNAYTILAVCIVLSGSSFAATINATSCNIADISNAVDLANINDSVRIPAGNCSWTATLMINKSIKIIGAGSGGDGTNILTASANGYIFLTNGTNNWRISSIHFLTPNYSYYAIKVNSGNTQTSVGWRIDNCTFTGHHLGIATYGTTTGVIDHNVFEGGGITVQGTDNAAWSTATDLGSGNFLFIEDNHFTDKNALTHPTNAVIVNWGGRVVFRHNVCEGEDTGPFPSMMSIDAHGYGHGPTTRGTRAFEVYNNTFRTGMRQVTNAIFIRAGTGVVYDNLIDSSKSSFSSGAIEMTEYRIKTAPSGTEGGGSLSSNCSASQLCFPDYYALQISGSTLSSADADHTLTGGTSGSSGTMLAFATNRVYFLTAPSGPYYAGETVTSSGTGHTAIVVANYSLVHGEGYPCCDQVGRGQNQETEPYYFWNNIDQNGQNIIPDVKSYTTQGYISMNSDYYLSQKASYAPYTYPHPLTVSSDECSCNSRADSNLDGQISLSEILSFIGQWKLGNATLAELLQAIGKWKGGCI